VHPNTSWLRPQSNLVFHIGYGIGISDGLPGFITQVRQFSEQKQAALLKSIDDHLTAGNINMYISCLTDPERYESRWLLLEVRQVVSQPGISAPERVQNLISVLEEWIVPTST